MKNSSALVRGLTASCEAQVNLLSAPPLGLLSVQPFFGTKVFPAYRTDADYLTLDGELPLSRILHKNLLKDYVLVRISASLRIYRM